MVLSIIVPVYNVEKFLDECIDSLFHQGLDECDFEVILVNDGSLDSSLEIANTWASKHRNISVYSQQNQGQAVARNLGLDKVCGKYVMFVDSDDYLVQNKINMLLDIAEYNDTDLCISPIIKQQSNGVLEYFNAPYTVLNKNLTGEQALLNGYNAASVCSMIFKRDFLESANFRFRSGFTHEDVEFSSRITAFANRIYFTDMHFYIYRWNNNSTDKSQLPENIKRGIISNFYVAHYFKKNTNNDILSKNLKKYYLHRCNSIVVSSLFTLYEKNAVDDNFVKECIDKCMKLGVYPINGRTSSWKTTMLIPLLNFKSVYSLFMRLMISYKNMSRH
jgi:glycosyltransferase involved in cell wall biosynthesis